MPVNKRLIMSLGNIEYVNLETLAHADYKIIDGQADITGWKVIDESGDEIGKIEDLLFDREQNTIRYVVVKLNDDISVNEEKSVLFPIGFINLADDKREVVVPVMNEQQYNSMPPYIIGEVTRDMEVKIRRAIGSPAALRLEEEVVELDNTNFYQHHHFDRGRNTTDKKEFDLSENNNQQFVNNTREVEENTIHQLIENSESTHTSDYKEESSTTKSFEQFHIETVQGVYTVEPQENGTYRIFDKGEKLGVIYAEAAQNEGVQWRTMDTIDDRLVAAIGEAIATHNNLQSDR